MRGIVLLLVLATGLGVGYLLGVSKQPAAPARAGHAPLPLREPPPAIRPAGDTSLAKALRDLPLPHVDGGSGTITGRITRPDGTPVAGVTVSATASTDHEGRVLADGPPPPPDIEEEVRRFVADLQQRQMSAVEAVTGSDGRYALSGLTDRAHDVQGYLAGFRVGAVPGTDSSRARPGATVDFTADAVVEVAFEVLLPDGATVPDATIHLKWGSTSSAHPWSRDGPRIRVSPGNYVCTAEHGEGDYRSDPVPLELREGAPALPTVLLRLRSRSGIRGTLSLTKDFPFPDASVCALAYTGEKAPDAALLGEQGKQDWTTADRGFRYQILDLPAGRYLVGVELGLAVVTTRVVDVGDRIETCDFAIDAIDPGLYVALRVLDPAGKPVLDATFGTGYRSDGRSSFSSGGTMAMRPDGSYVVFHHAHSGEEGGTYFITAESPRYGKKEVGYRRAETKELVVRFLEAATVELAISGFASSEHAGALTVGLTSATTGEDAFGRWSDTQAPDPEGRITLGPVETGDYDLTLYAGRGERWEALPAETRRITLVPGKNAVSLPMPRLYSLAVADPEGKPGGSLALDIEARHGMSLRARLDDTGRAVFAPLPEGRYQLRRGDDATGAMRVTLPGPAEIVFRPQPYNALRVTVTDAGSVWAKAGFQDGDMVVAIDGDELESLDELRLAHAALPAKDRVTLAVLRGGSRIELRVNARELFGGSATGGRVEWATR